MTVLELRKLLRSLPPDMPVMVPFEDILLSACHTDSGVTFMKDMDGLVDSGEDVKVFVLSPCMCDLDLDEDEFTDDYYADEDEIKPN